MFKAHLKLSWRTLLRNRQFTLLNLLGLSTGLAGSFLIGLWIADEWKMNKFTANDNRIYQVMQAVKGGQGAVENTPGLLAATLPTEMPEVEKATAVIPPSWFSEKGLFLYNDKNIRAGGGFASENFFSVFPRPFLAGTPSQVFVDKNRVALSKELALSLFGTTDNVIGKVIEWNQKDFAGNYAVAGVFESFPKNSTLHFDAVFNYDFFLEKNPKLLKWGNNDPSTFVLLKQGVKNATFNQKIAGFLKTKKPDSKTALFAQRFSDTYLYNRYENGQPAGGRIEYVKLFSIIAVFILLIACVNFMNLSTAKAMQRLREVGVRKAIGASRRSLVVQYLTESVFVAAISLLVAAVLVVLLLPAFNRITGKELSLEVNPAMALVAIGAAVFTGLVAGSYPALYLSRFRPALVLKGLLKNTASETVVRKGLVVFQFTVSLVLIVAVMIVYRQMGLIQKTDLGYDRARVIYFDKGGKLSDKKDDYKQGAVYKDLDAFVQRIKSIPGVENAANFRHSIVNRSGGTTDVSWPGKAADDQTSFTDIACGYDFIQTLGIRMKEGRPYSKDFGSDSDKIVVNEAAVAAMGLANPIGKTITIWGAQKQIIGVTKDFHFQSLYETIKPCFFDLTLNQRAAKIAVKLKAGSEQAALDRLSKFYKTATGEALSFQFLDDDYQALYASEERLSALSKYFAGMAIIISCLGLFGLAAFTAQKRQKEIGIRRVVGASVSSITAMLSKDFLKLVLLSCVVALPLSWWLMNSWLQAFAYRTKVAPSIFLLSAAAVLLLALLTVSTQSIRAATSNTVKSLRSE